MRIGIDARPLTMETFAGISNYEYQLVSSWMEHHPEHEYFLLSRRDTCFQGQQLPENWHIMNTPWVIDKQKLWFLFELPKLIRELKLDVYWGPNYSLPQKVSGVRYCLSVHDLAIFKFRHVGQWKNAVKIKLFLRRDIRNAEKVFAISESTKRDLISMFGVSSEKIRVTYLSGGDERKRSENHGQNGIQARPEGNQTAYTPDKQLEHTSDIRPEIRQLDSLFLFVGTIEPRKNILTIIKGYEQYCNETAAASKEPLPLVLAGARGWNCEAIYQAVASSPYRAKILMPGYITDDEKEMLYQKAKAFLYPSLYEGFGIPVLEAFSRGVPVVTANNSSLPEVGGDAAFYMDTMDVGKLASYLKELSELQGQRLRELQERMKQQAARFSWERCAEETLQEIVRAK